MAKDEEMMRLQAREIERVLNAKNLMVRVVGGNQGHRLTVYHLTKPAHIDLAAVRRQEEEIALALHTSSCRIGRRGGYITVEVPCADPQPADLMPLLEMVDVDGISPLVGVDEEGVPLLLPLASPNVAHALIVGTTGSGKTELARAMIASLSLSSPVYELGLMLIDPKRRGYAPFAGLPHLVHPIIYEPKEGLGALAWATAEMERRDRSGLSEPRLVVFIDELADLMLVESETETRLMRLVQRGREAGIHVVACTQKPTTSAIGSLVKANFPCRIIGKVTDTNDAYVASGISGTGAERLLGKGDFLVVAGGDVIRMQAAYIGEDEIARLVMRLRGGRRVERAPADSAQSPGRIIDFVERYRSKQQAEASDGVDEAQIRADLSAGTGINEVQRKHFGYVGGHAYRAVTAIRDELDGDTSRQGVSRASGG